MSLRLSAAQAAALVGVTPPGARRKPVRGAREAQGGMEIPLNRTVTIEIPLPPRHCQSNGPHFHWAVKARARSQYRQEAFYCAKEQHATTLQGPVRLSVDVYAARKAYDGRYRPVDAQNLVAAMKGALDGIVDAGVIRDDNHKCLTWDEVRFLTTKSEHLGRACCVLTFREEGEETP